MEHGDFLSHLKVLVVDDNSANRTMLQSFLRRLGCTSVPAENGAQAIEVFQREAPDLILMDVMMPVMDGYEATRRIKALASDWVPVVFLSALDKDEHLVQGLEAGGDDYLAKPTNLVVLQAKLHSLARTLALQRRLDENRRLTQAIFDNIADCVITIEETGRVVSANAAVEKVFGYRPAELIGQPVGMLMPESMRDLPRTMIDEYLANGRPGVAGGAPRQVPGRRKDGGELVLEAAMAELRLAGNQRHFVGIVRDVTRRAAAERSLREHAEALQRYHDDREAENALASEIMRRHLQRPGLRDPRFHYWLTPASDFSGDVVAACRSPKGKLYAMLADGTGHGLAAAISLLPVLTTFYGLAERDHQLGYMAMEMNRQLLAFMPTGRFVAAGLICLNAEDRIADLWLGGMPELMLLESSGTLRNNLASPHLPLGIVDFDEDSSKVYHVQCPPDSQLVMFSDGLIEAADAVGDAFGRHRLSEVLTAAPAGRRVDAVKDALTEHLGGATPQDDISMLVIDC